MRRRELLSVGAVLAAGIAGCAAEPIEEQNESEVEEGGGPGEGIEEENVTEDDGNDSDDGETDWDVDPTADEDDAGEDESDADEEVDDAEDDGPPSGDDPMLDDEDDSEEFDPDETFEGEEEAETLTIGIVGPAGERIEGATVVGERVSDGAGFEGETDDDGTHTADLPEGIYTIEVEHPSYERRTVEYAHEEASEVAIELEAVEAAPDVSGLRLVVVDTDGEPIEGASIRGEGAPLEADVPLVFTGETDADGEYTDRLYENEYVIDLAHPDYEDRTVEYDHDGPTELVVELGSA